MTRPTQPPRLTALEDRAVPSAAALGEPWPDAGAVSLSFVKDGTRAGDAGSGLFGTLNKVAKADDWQIEILRGFQSWAAVSNLNVGLVDDGGDPFGTPGDVEGDYRFGDIRVGGRPLSADALANAVPFSWGAGTWAGDVLFNTGVRYGINPTQAGVYDLFTVAAHEAGHSFGLPHSDDPASILGEDYAGTKAGLAASDVARVQALYGARLPDRFEGTTGNDTWAGAAVLNGTGNIQVSADLTTAADVDYFRFLTPAKADRFTVRLGTSGVSLLTAKVTVYDAAGRVVGADVSTDPRSGDLEVKVDRPTGGSFYTVRVEAARADVFGVGRYSLAVVYKDAPAAKADPNDRGANDTPAGATVLVADSDGNGNGNGWGSDGAVFAGRLETKADVDYYRVTAPADGGPVLLVRVRGTGTQDVPPVVTVLDADMNPVFARVVERNGSALTVEVDGVLRGRDYFVRVQGNGTDATNGAYRLRAAFTAPRTNGLDALLGGGLGGSATTATGRLSLASGTLFQFNLAAAGAAGATVKLTVTDARGKVVAAFTQAAGAGPGLVWAYLPAGDYTVTVSLTLPKGAPAGLGVNYLLTGGVGSDPLGTLVTTTATRPSAATTTTTTTTTPPTTTTTTTTTMTSPAPPTYTFTPTVWPVLMYPYSF